MSFESKVYNVDCMQAMRKIPDKYFDIAVVDPPYGSGSQSVKVERELFGGGADWESKTRSRFGGRFERYYIGSADRRNTFEEIPDKRGYL